MGTAKSDTCNLPLLYNLSGVQVTGHYVTDTDTTHFVFQVPSDINIYALINPFMLFATYYYIDVICLLPAFL